MKTIKIANEFKLIVVHFTLRELHIPEEHLRMEINGSTVKDDASIGYCAYVLRISGYSRVLRNLLTNTTTFLRGL